MPAIQVAANLYGGREVELGDVERIVGPVEVDLIGDRVAGDLHVVRTTHDHQFCDAPAITSDEGQERPVRGHPRLRVHAQPTGHDPPSRRGAAGPRAIAQQVPAGAHPVPTGAFERTGDGKGPEMS